MDAVRTFEIHFLNEPALGYYEGQEIRGEVQLDLAQDMVIESLELEFFGTARVNWRLKEEKDASSRKKRRKRRNRDTPMAITPHEENYLNQTISLYTRDTASSNFLVSMGKQVFQFQVQLPYNLPSTFTANHGNIQYVSQATLTRPWHRKETTSKEFRVRTIRDLNHLPQALKPIFSEIHQDQSLLCCVVGNIQANWHLDRMGYVPGEVIHIHGQVNNKSRMKVKQAKASLVQHVRYFEPPERRYLHERRSVRSVTKGEILPGATQFWREEIIVPDTPPSGLKGCTLMELWYTLKMKVTPGGPLERLETTTDIIVGSVAKGDSLANYEVTTSAAPCPSATAAAAAAETALELSYFI